MSYKKEWKYLEVKRTNKLQASDWTQFNDSPLTDTKKAEWATYRQQLRDFMNTLRAHSDYVSDTATNPADLVVSGWPTKPS